MAEPIRIGVSLPQSGRDARGAWASHYNAYRLWLDDLNGRGGLLGREVQLIVYDDGSMPARSLENYERLIRYERVDLLFAPARSRTIEQVAPLCDRERKLLFVGHGSAHGMFQQGRKYLFLGWPGTDFDTTRSFFEWASTLRHPPRRLALLYPYDPRPTYREDPYHGINQHNVGVVSGTRSHAQQFGFEIAFDDEYRDDGFDELFARVEAAKPDAVLVANYALQQGDQQLGSLMDALRRHIPGDAPLWLYRVPISTGDGAGAGNRGVDPRLARHRADPMFEGVLPYEQWNARSPHPSARAFVDAFIARNDYVPDNISAGVYVCCQLVEQAVTATGTTDNEILRRRLLGNDFDTVMGTYRFQENGVPVARQLLLQVIDGELEVIHPEEEKTC